MAHSNRIFTLLAAAALMASCSSDKPGTSEPGNPNPGVGVPNPGTPNPGSSMPVPRPGQTTFTTEEANGSNPNGGPARAADSAAGTAGAAPSLGAAPPTANPAMPPTGRMADVEEGDIYKVDHNRLLYLNTYRGFVIYDVNDPKNPKRLGRLPVFGYPVEMFVSGNTVYALLRDALYLTQVGDNLQFERHNVSQLVTIDITDLANPKVLKTIDIVGQLREGVSRKIQDTIYVVSYIPRSYFWGWRPDPAQQKEMATVYSFNVANPQEPSKVGEMKIFEGGSLTVSDSQGNYYDRNFQSVAISATANALMVVENWSVSASTSGPIGPRGVITGCGTYSSNQFARVSLIDISNPNGDIQLQAAFETGGNLNDQFKMTYVDDPVANTGTFYGIFNRQVWESQNCQGNSYTQNTIESWDVSVKGQPRKLNALDFGKRNETVRGSAFDPTRKIAYAITAQRIDPLYAISFADREKLTIASAIDGLSGDMSVFRLVADKKFLLAVGVDASVACTGFQDTSGAWRPTKIAVSIIDVQDLSKIRLVQRQCVAVKNADWITSGVTNNLDQAHKMLGMHADGSMNVITVPISYSKRVDSANNWYWYQWQTAVGLMTWDLTKYDVTKDETQQQVITNYGTFVHPHGEVRRSIVFTHEGATPERMMINLSDTHISIASIQDLNNPTLESEIELAPYYNQIYRFGDYLVEQVQGKPSAWGDPAQEVSTFRVKRAGGDADSAVPLASFDVGQVYRVLKHDKSLVLLRQTFSKDPNIGVYVPPTTEALVVDFSDPTNPRLAGKTALPSMASPYYHFWCGMGAYWGGFWFQDVQSFAMTDRGFAFYVAEWRYENNIQSFSNKLVFLDVRNADLPTTSEKALSNTYEWGSYGMVPDPMDPRGFYLSTRKKVGEYKTADGATYTQFKYFAQRWQPEGDVWSAAFDVNTPGRLIRTWKSSAGQRMFLSQDTNYRILPDDMYKRWVYDYRLSLLRQVTVAGAPAAELLDAQVFTDIYPAALLIDGDKLFMNGQPQLNYYYGFGVGDAVAPPGGVGVGRPVASGSSSSATVAPLPSWESTSDRIMIFDLAANKLTLAYDQPTRMYNVQLMGTNQGKLFVNLAGSGSPYYYDGSYGYGGGDGILVVDVSTPAAPRGVRFLRTLGFATHIEFFGDDAYVASGYFGLSHLSLAAPPAIPVAMGP